MSTKYKIYDWDGNLVKSDIESLEKAVEVAVTNGCEVHDENGDIVFSEWDGWNGDYPGIESIWFPVLDRKESVTMEITLSPEDIENIASSTGKNIITKEKLKEAVMTILQTNDWLTLFVRQEAAYRLEELGKDTSSEEIDAVANALYYKSEQWIDSNAVCEIVEE